MVAEVVISQSSLGSAPQADSPSAGSAAPVHDVFPPEIVRHEPRNLLLLALNQIVIRVGWIFKTETVIIPAFLDSIAGASWIRGFLPVLNRVGFSVPPVYMAASLEARPRKKWFMITMLCAMAVLMMAMAGVWRLFGTVESADTAMKTVATGWLTVAVLVLYGTFFSFMGLFTQAFNTLQGKLIQPARRGRLLTVSTFFGSFPAVLAAWWLLPGWLASKGGGFDWAFLAAGACLALAAVVAVFVIEPAEHVEPDDGEQRLGPFRTAWQVLKDDRPFRGLMVVAALLATGHIVFPHYQALARERLEMGGGDMMVWVVVQNISTGLSSLLVGPLADRFGNRLALRTAIAGFATTPLVALALAQSDPVWGRRLFWLVFVSLGTMPVTYKTLVNYTLEMAPRAQQPRYISTMNLCYAAPIFLAPLVGWLADVTSFELVFIGATLLLGLSVLLTFTLHEPRHRLDSRPVDSAPF
ncbi:MAG: MFS transporter [Pirellulales bacterium]